MAPREYTSFEKFWPYYLSEHSKPITRSLHLVGTGLGLVSALAGVVSMDWRLILGFPVLAYGFAWYAHFFLEKNRPATFTYPLWSLRGDFKMIGFMLTGKLGGELARFHITPRGEAAAQLH